MTVTTTPAPQTITKTVAGKTITMTPEQAEAFGQELDELRQRVIAHLGERDATYIRRIIKAQRALEVGGRVLLFMPPFWLAGTAMLGQAARRIGTLPPSAARRARKYCISGLSAAGRKKLSCSTCSSVSGRLNRFRN